MSRLKHIFVILFLSIPIVFSQSPITDTSGKSNQCETKTKDTDTESNNLLNKHISAVNNDTYSIVTEEKESYNTTDTKKKLFDWNFWLVVVGIFQGGIFIWQIFYLRKTVKSSELNAQSIKNSEKAYLFTNVKGQIYTSPKPIFKGNIIIKNVGKTPAFAIEVIFDNNVNLTINYKILKDSSPIGSNIGSCEQIELPFDVDMTEKNLNIIGKVTYKDIFNTCRVTAFCWEFNESEGRFSLNNDKKLTYYI